jgi:hypothetical protein
MTLISLVQITLWEDKRGSLIPRLAHQKRELRLKRLVKISLRIGVKSEPTLIFSGGCRYVHLASSLSLNSQFPHVKAWKVFEDFHKLKSTISLYLIMASHFIQTSFTTFSRFIKWTFLVWIFYSSFHEKIILAYKVKYFSFFWVLFFTRIFFVTTCKKQKVK